MLIVFYWIFVDKKAVAQKYSDTDAENWQYNIFYRLLQVEPKLTVENK